MLHRCSAQSFGERQPTSRVSMLATRTPPLVERASDFRDFVYSANVAMSASGPAPPESETQI